MLPFRVPHVQTAPCRVVIDAAVDAWIAKLQRVVMTQLHLARRKWKSNPQTNVLPVVRWAQRYLRERQLVAIPCDKEFGFCLETLDAHRSVQQDILEGNAYQEVPMRTIDKVALCGVYAKFCHAVAALENNLDFAHEMLKSARSGSSILLYLLTTIKTHKAQGKIEHRNVHAGAQWAFTGLAQWVTVQLMENLKYDHLLTGLQDFVKKVSEIQVPSGSIMYRRDIKHFFLSGAPLDLCDNAVAILPRGRRRDLLSKVLLWLLDSQWISSKMHNDRCFKVMRGSGMGLTHSSAVCDAALFFLAEATWATKLEIQQAFAIKAYFRF